MKNKVSIIEAAMKYKEITILITSLMVIFGIYALMVMPRQEFPEFIIRQGVIVAVMPGATSQQTESQMAIPIENYLFSYKEVNKKKTYSQSKDGVTYIFVELNEDVTQPSMFWSKLKHGLNNLKSSLSPDIYGIFVNDDFGNTSAMLISLESETASYKDLQTLMKGLESRLRRIDAVSKLNRVGMQDEVFNIYLKPEKLMAYGVKPLMILMSMKSEGSVSYGGDVDNNSLELPIHFASKYRTAEDIAEKIIYSDPQGNIVRIKDIATVKREQKTPDSYITNNKKKCLLLSIEMLEGNNIVQFGKDVSQVIQEYQKELPTNVKINTIANQPSVVSESIEHFLSEFVMAILSVILVTMLLLPLRVSSVAATSIPISVLMSLGILYLFNVELDTVTLAGLIIVLGMVVDNSIVIIDNYIEKLDHGIKPWDAAIKSAKELFIPVFTATLAIISMFAPLAIFMTGTGRDFIQSFPLTIAVTLFSSLLVAVLLVPYISFKLIKVGLKTTQEGNTKKRKSFLDYMQNIYDKSLDFAFKYNKSTVILSFLSVILGIALMGVLPMEFFPKMDRDQFAVEIYLPQGTALAKTDSISKKMEDILLKDQRITNVTTFVGTSSPRFHTLYAPNMPAKNYAQMIVNTTSNEATIAVLNEYTEKYADHFPEAHIKFKQLDMQASAAPIEVRISGDSIKDLKNAAEKISEIYRADKRVSWIRNNYEEAKPTLVYDINYTEAARLGFSKTDISTFLMVYQNGFPLTQVWEDDYPISVQLIRDKSDSSSSIENNNIYIPSMFLPGLIPLRQIATPRIEWNEGQIVRRNGVRTLSVWVDVKRGEVASSVLNDASAKTEKLKLPSSIKISYGAEQEGQDEQYPHLFNSLILGVILIFFILLFQFKKIKTSILIMITMPLSFFGAIAGLLIVGYPFGMTSFIGLISLCGVVIRNGIILVDYAIQLRKTENISVKEAAIAAGKRRMRPILLTSAAAAVGVVPMIISKSPLWGPLATIICFGLLFSMLMTLIVLPVLYWYFFKSEDKHPKPIQLEK